MKPLVAIQSCVNYALNGSHQAMRDSWLKDLRSEYRFFMGDGTPITEDTTALNKTWEEAGHYRNKVFVDPDYHMCRPKSDEVAIQVPDRYFYGGYLMRGICRWALEREFDFIFMCFPDTYVVPERLLSSGYEKHDYSGFLGDCRNICGGPGEWFSRKAAQTLSDAPVDHWASDQWAGEVLRTHGIEMTADNRYSHLCAHEPPSQNNDMISSHIANFPEVYRIEQMFELYKKYKGIL